MRVWCSTLTVMLGLLLTANCAKRPESGRTQVAVDSLPLQSFDRPPEQPFDRSDYVIGFKQMGSFYDVPGEFGHYVDGEEYGFKSLSIIMSETRPNGGPPLHTHETEEAHVLFSGTVEYIIGDRRFTVEGPYVVRIPAGVPHAFLNVGKQPATMTAVFPSGRLTYKEIEANPLVREIR